MNLTVTCGSKPLLKLPNPAPPPELSTPVFTVISIDCETCVVITLPWIELNCELPKFVGIAIFDVASFPILTSFSIIWIGIKLTFGVVEPVVLVAIEPVVGSSKNPYAEFACRNAEADPESGVSTPFALFAWYQSWSNWSITNLTSSINTWTLKLYEYFWPNKLNTVIPLKGLVEVVFIFSAFILLCGNIKSLLWFSSIVNFQSAVPVVFGFS